MSLEPEKFRTWPLPSPAVAALPPVGLEREAQAPAAEEESEEPEEPEEPEVEGMESEEGLRSGQTTGSGLATSVSVRNVFASLCIMWGQLGAFVCRFDFGAGCF